MTGVFIKGMTLPSSCSVCPLSMLDSYEYRNCFITGHDVTGCNGWTADRHDECPMRECEMEEKED